MKNLKILYYQGINADDLADAMKTNTFESVLGSKAYTMLNLMKQTETSPDEITQLLTENDMGLDTPGVYDIIKGASDANSSRTDGLPENTSDAGKEGSKEWKQAQKKIKESTGKGVNV